MTDASGAVCSFCGRSASEAGPLIETQGRRICKDCSRIASNLAEDQRDGRILHDGSLEIGRFAADVELAQRIGRATLERYPFVPLAVRDDHVVLAVASFEALNDLKEIVLDALGQMAATDRQRDVVDFVLAGPEAILSKITPLFTVDPERER